MCGVFIVASTYVGPLDKGWHRFKLPKATLSLKKESHGPASHCVIWGNMLLSTGMFASNQLPSSGGRRVELLILRDESSCTTAPEKATDYLCADPRRTTKTSSQPAFFFPRWRRRRPSELALSQDSVRASKQTRQKRMTSSLAPASACSATGRVNDVRTCAQPQP